MQSNIYSTKAASVANFAAILASLVKPQVPITYSNDHNAMTGELSLLDLFEVSRAYHERYGEKAEMMEEDSYPSVTASKKVGAREELEFKVISQVISGGVSLHLHVYGRTGSVELNIERSAWSSRASSEMITTAEFYGTNAADEPFRIEGRESFAAELLKLWYAKDDEALTKRMVELHSLLTPKKPRPAYVILSQPQEFPDCSEDAEEGQRVTVPAGLFTLLGGDYDNPNAAYKQVLYDANGFYPTTAGMALTEWEAAEAASDGAIELVYHHEVFHWMPQSVKDTDADERMKHNGQPFQVLSAGFEDGSITTYHISFEDGFDTWASPMEIELVP